MANQWRFIGPASPPLIFGVVFFGGKERGCVPTVRRLRAWADGDRVPLPGGSNVADTMDA